MLLNRHAQERSARERELAQLAQLYASNGVALSAAAVPEDARLSAVDPERDLAAEAAFAEALLGRCGSEEMGGGIYRYTGEAGQCLLRSSGMVEAALDRAVDDPEQFADRLCESFGYRLESSELTALSGTVRAVRVVSENVVFNAGLDLVFSDGRLVSVAGFFLPAAEAAAAAEKSMGAVTALVRFLDYSNSSGEVCTAITGVDSGYLLQNTAPAAVRLLPAWRISTDVNQYYVNMATGEVTREST